MNEQGQTETEEQVASITSYTGCLAISPRRLLIQSLITHRSLQESCGHIGHIGLKNWTVNGGNSSSKRFKLASLKPAMKRVTSEPPRVWYHSRHSDYAVMSIDVRVMDNSKLHKSLLLSQLLFLYSETVLT